MHVFNMQELGMSVLMCAAKHGLSEVCALLVECRADINAENEVMRGIIAVQAV